ncbi:MAG: FAD-dependent monooxygenase [Deltaproteobacteria bacterium]|nr:FAD-dependent monooxygenase [Deltaproteobacteria bacterium]
MRVGIVGCGTAGAAAAILLARAGCEVTVLERVEKPGAVGAGIILQPTGQAVLARLGLLDEIAAKGARLDRLFLRTREGRTLVDLHYARCDRSWFGLGIHRGALFEALYRTACAEVRVHTGVAIEALRHEGEVVYAGDHGPFDLVVLADGASSTLRDAKVSLYPWGALWFVAKTEAFAGELYQVAERARKLYGILPTGQGLASLFWSLPADGLDAWRADFAGWKRDVLAMDPRAAPVLDQIAGPEAVTFARYRDVRMGRWHDGRVVTIGDAAHATSPQLGQGANLALVDALVLAACVTAAPVPEALALYQRQRAEHLRHYQRMTRVLTPFFQSHSSLLGWLRDWTFPIANALPPLNKHMVRTMAGVSLGMVARPLALSSLPATRVAIADKSA